MFQSISPSTDGHSHVVQYERFRRQNEVEVVRSKRTVDFLSSSCPKCDVDPKAGDRQEMGRKGVRVIIRGLGTSIITSVHSHSSGHDGMGKEGSHTETTNTERG